MNQEAWDELYPDGFRSSFSMRHMSKKSHRRAKHVASMLEFSLEQIIMTAIDIGLDELEKDLAESIIAERG